MIGHGGDDGRVSHYVSGGGSRSCSCIGPKDDPVVPANTKRGGPGSGVCSKYRKKRDGHTDAQSVAPTVVSALSLTSHVHVAGSKSDISVAVHEGSVAQARSLADK